MPTDVADPQAVERLFAQAVQRFGRVDLLFNNAGVGAPAVLLEELPIDEWKRVVDINLNGMFYCLREAFRVMKSQSPQGGRIINNGSISAHAPRPNSIAYTATKHAVMGLTKAASLDGRKFDIAVGQIDVGNAGTELAQRMTQGVPQANGQIAAEPLMDVDIVARSVLYMAELPLEANVLFHTVMATRMPFVGRGMRPLRRGSGVHARSLPVKGGREALWVGAFSPRRRRACDGLPCDAGLPSKAAWAGRMRGPCINVSCRKGGRGVGRRSMCRRHGVASVATLLVRRQEGPGFADHVGLLENAGERRWSAGVASVFRRGPGLPVGQG